MGGSMKAKDIAKQHGLNLAEFSNWLQISDYNWSTGFVGGLDVHEDHDADEVASAFKAYIAEQNRLAEEEETKQQLAAQQKQQALASMLITSGFNFDGFTITKYSGYISGDDAVQVARGQQGIFGGGVTDVGASLMASLVQIRRQALLELKEAAYALGCNAVIGVDFDYITLDPQTATSGGGTLYLPYVFGVTANGNAVIIEKNES
jgi:uncharacterized protein YbjQ (UPF0145 family)